MDLSADVWSNLMPQHLQASSEIPYITRRKFIDIWKMKMRAEEELQITEQDLKTLVDNLAFLQAAVEQKIETLTDSVSPLELGQKGYLRRHGDCIKWRLSYAKDLLQTIQNLSDTDAIVDNIEDQLEQAPAHVHHDNTDNFVRLVEEENSDDSHDETDLS